MIIPNSIIITPTASAASTSLAILDFSDGDIVGFAAFTSAGLSVTTASIVSQNAEVELKITQKYLDSLSTEQLAELDNQLSQKEELLTVGTNTYQIDYSTNNNQVATEAKTYQKLNKR